MGDMADMLHEQAWDENFEDQRFSPFRPAVLACKFCGSKSVKWGRLNGSWRLFTNGEPHTCTAFRLHQLREEKRMGLHRSNQGGINHDSETLGDEQPTHTLSVVKHDGKFLLDGKFFMVQRADLGANTSTNCKVDNYGNPTLEWPGRSVYGTREEAEQVAAALAAKSPGYPFVVMEAVAAVAQAAPAVVKRAMPLTRR